MTTPFLSDTQTVLEKVYTDEQLSVLDLKRVPHHIALIMDGNRRWANKQGLPRIMGHWQGAESITKIVTAAAALGIKVLTVFAFSTENWSRESEEIDALMHIFKSYLIQKRNHMLKEGVKLDAIGDHSRLPTDVKKALEESKIATSQCDRIELVLGLNYGGRDDIRRGILSFLEDYDRGKVYKSDLSEEFFSNYLDTAKWLDPELLIRTSGEQRISNFLLWQISYTEVYVTDVLWPDFNEQDLLDAVIEFQKRQRRLGGR